MFFVDTHFLEHFQNFPNSLNTPATHIFPNFLNVPQFSQHSPILSTLPTTLNNPKFSQFSSISSMLTSLNSLNTSQFSQWYHLYQFFSAMQLPNPQIPDMFIQFPQLYHSQNATISTFSLNVITSTNS